MHASSFRAGLLFPLLAAALTARANAQCTPGWLPGEGFPGLNGSIGAAAVWDDGTGPALYVGGQFSIAGNAWASNIAKWNGSSWSALGSGMNSTVEALTVYKGQLIAGGFFTTAGGISANRIAAWNGSSWSALGSGIGSYSDDVQALTVYNGQLIAGGYFTTGSGAISNYIAAWDGSSWSALGGGINSTVYALTVFNGQLIAAGHFTTAGGLNANYIAAWNGNSWSTLGSGMNYEVHALTVYNGQLIAGGSFTTAGGVSANHIAVWNPGTPGRWSALRTGMDSHVNALTVFDGQLIAGGTFTTASGVSVNCIAAWNGSSWSALGSGVNNLVEVLTVYNGQLITGGWFDTAGSIRANYIAAWNGNSWSALGSGMNYNANVSALTVYNGRLIAGGSFATAGGVSANRIAAWDSSNWESLGCGISGWHGSGMLGGYTRISALAVFKGQVIAGGEFTTAGGVSANRIAAWNPGAPGLWSALGSGMGTNPPYAPDVRALAVYNGQLIAGGMFTTAGGVNANYIAAWNGSSWSALGSGMGGTTPPYFPYVSALAVYNGQLIAAGGFTKAGGVSANYIAAWNGSSWSALGNGMGGTTLPYPHALTVYNGQLIAGGGFTTADGLSANYIAAWDGSFWSALGSGMNRTVSALTVYNGQLIAGGSFTTAGGNVSAYWARWGSPDNDSDGVADCEDACPASDPSTTIAIGGCDTGVNNQPLGTGCTTADEIAKTAAGARNHGQFVSGVAELTNAWAKAGLISGAEKGRIQSCAARSATPAPQPAQQRAKGK